MTKRYEFVFVIRPKLTSPKKKKFLSTLEEELKKEGGKVEKKVEWGEKVLAYPIEKEEKGEYFFWEVSFAKSPKMAELNTFLNRTGEVLRYLWVRKREVK